MFKSSAFGKLEPIFFLGRGTLTACQRRRIFPQWWAVNQLLLEAQVEARDAVTESHLPSPPVITPVPPPDPHPHPQSTHFPVRASHAHHQLLHLQLLPFTSASSDPIFSLHHRHLPFLSFLPPPLHLPHPLLLPLHPHFTPPAGSHPWRTGKRRSSLSQHRFTFPSRSGRTTGMKD